MIPFYRSLECHSLIVAVVRMDLSKIHSILSYINLKSDVIYVSNHACDLGNMEYLAGIPCTKGSIKVLKNHSTTSGLKNRMDYKDLLSFQHPVPFNNTILHGRELIVYILKENSNAMRAG